MSLVKTLTMFILGCYSLYAVKKLYSSCLKMEVAMLHNARKNPHETVVRRGDILRVDVMKDSHIGHFRLWPAILTNDVFSREAHDYATQKFYGKEAYDSFVFLPFCPGLRLSLHTQEPQHACEYDRAMPLFRHYIRIPGTYTDGIYVLGFVRHATYAANQSTRKAIEDFCGCIRIRVTGGPMCETCMSGSSTAPTQRGTKKASRSTYKILSYPTRSCFLKSRRSGRPTDFVRVRRHPLSKKWYLQQPRWIYRG